MQYREMGKTGDKVSILGYGCMRFPRAGGRVDIQRAGRQVASAVERGVNYLDTAYLYPGNEANVGTILSGGLREKVMLATKLPPMQVSSRRDMEKILDTQLRRLKTDYIDYYLMHMLMTYSGWERLKTLGVEDFLQKARESGKIRRAAFSYHGDRDNFIKIIDDYDWDMCQLQYNYVDEHNQATRAGLDYAGKKGVGVVVMEPLRGGRLANRLPDTVLQTLKNAGENTSPAEWALRWVWDNPYVTTLLSGMNEEAHIDENIRVAGSAAPNALTEGERQMFADIRRDIKEREPVPCTSCGYCQPCPKGVAIPLCFTMLNDMRLFDDKRQRMWYISRLTGVDGSAPSYASLCSGCGACEKKCPQGLPIREHLETVKKSLEPWYFRPAAAVVRAYMKIRRRKHQDLSAE